MVNLSRLVGVDFIEQIVGNFLDCGVVYWIWINISWIDVLGEMLVPQLSSDLLQVLNWQLIHVYLSNL